MSTLRCDLALGDRRRHAPKIDKNRSAIATSTNSRCIASSPRSASSCAATDRSAVSGFSSFQVRLNWRTLWNSASGALALPFRRPIAVWN